MFHTLSLNAITRCAEAFMASVLLIDYNVPIGIRASLGSILFNVSRLTMLTFNNHACLSSLRYAWFHHSIASANVKPFYNQKASEFDVRGSQFMRL
jgi:hypothetical protein